MLRFRTNFWSPIRRLYTQAGLPQDWNYETIPRLSWPAALITRAFTPPLRDIAAKLYTMRQFSGFASPRKPNKRYVICQKQGGEVLSVAFDLPR